MLHSHTAIHWRKFPDTMPPLNTEVLVIGRLFADDEPRIHTDTLYPPGARHHPESTLYFWDSSDWDEVTHWAPYPALPR